MKLSKYVVKGHVLRLFLWQRKAPEAEGGVGGGGSLPVVFGPGQYVT